MPGRRWGSPNRGRRIARGRRRRIAGRRRRIAGSRRRRRVVPGRERRGRRVAGISRRRGRGGGIVARGGRRGAIPVGTAIHHLCLLLLLQPCSTNLLGQLPLICQLLGARNSKETEEE